MEKISVYNEQADDCPAGRRVEQLWTLIEMRRSGVPLCMLRHNQLCLWVLRQRHLHPEYDDKTKFPEFPGWKENHTKFVLIHYVAGRA